MSKQKVKKTLNDVVDYVYPVYDNLKNIVNNYSKEVKIDVNNIKNKNGKKNMNKSERNCSFFDILREDEDRYWAFCNFIYPYLRGRKVYAKFIDISRQEHKNIYKLWNTGRYSRRKDLNHIYGLRVKIIGGVDGKENFTIPIDCSRHNDALDGKIFETEYEEITSSDIESELQYNKKYNKIQTDDVDVAYVNYIYVLVGNKPGIFIHPIVLVKSTGFFPKLGTINFINAEILGLDFDIHFNLPTFRSQKIFETYTRSVIAANNPYTDLKDDKKSFYSIEDYLNDEYAQLISRGE